jgi:hypothetical protein
VRFDGHATLTIKYGDYVIQAARPLETTDARTISN